MGLNIEKRFWKFTMILKFMGRDPNIQYVLARHYRPLTTVLPPTTYHPPPTTPCRRILVADVDAIATNAHNYWMLSMEGLVSTFEHELVKIS